MLHGSLKVTNKCSNVSSFRTHKTSLVQTFKTFFSSGNLFPIIISSSSTPHFLFHRFYHCMLCPLNMSSKFPICFLMVFISLDLHSISSYFCLLILYIQIQFSAIISLLVRLPVYFSVLAFNSGILIISSGDSSLLFFG